MFKRLIAALREFFSSNDSQNEDASINPFKQYQRERTKDSTRSRTDSGCGSCGGCRCNGDD